MPQNPFTTYNSNQRVVAIPPTPTAYVEAVITVAGVVTRNTIVLGPNSSAGNLAQVNMYFMHMTSDLTAAASGMTVVWGLQFQNAAHGAVGGVTNIASGAVGCSGATCQLSHCIEDPSAPMHFALVVPATAVEIALQTNAFGFVGAPVCRGFVGWGIDILNQGTTGDIGGAGMVAQSSTNPNTF